MCFASLPKVNLYLNDLGRNHPKSNISNLASRYIFLPGLGVAFCPIEKDCTS